MADPQYTPSVKNRLRFDRPQGLSDEQAQIGRDNLKVEEVMQSALSPITSAIEDLEEGKSDIGHSHSNATTSAAGFMSSTDKTKLDSVATGATNYTHPTQPAINIETANDGVSVVSRVQANAYGHVTVVSTRNLNEATTSAAGVMSAADKTLIGKLAAAMAPAITTQPIDQRSTPGSTATFSVAAVQPFVDPAMVKKWQKSLDSGSSWSDLTSSNVFNYTTPALTEDDDRVSRWRAVLTNDFGAKTSNAVAVNLWAQLEAETAGGVPIAPIEYTDGNGIAWQAYKFNTSGTLTVTHSGLVEYLIVAGGGSGASSNVDTVGAGGGGAGGLLHSIKGVAGALSRHVPAIGDYTVVVGAGGAAVSVGIGNDGSSSTLFGETAVGGGGGGGAALSANYTSGRNGGSGGGASGTVSSGAGGSGIVTQGHAGGSQNTFGRGGGGGGGYAATGESPNNITRGGVGGIGVSLTIDGTTRRYADGGGGSARGNATTTATGGAAGGSSGGRGADGTVASPVDATSGAVNTGGGGGAGNSRGVASGSGGSGVVIVRVRK